MHINRALKLRNQAIMQLRDLDSQARLFGMTNDAIVESSAKIFARMAKAPSWAKAYAQGYWQRLRDAWYEGPEGLIYCHVAPNGQRYTLNRSGNPLPEWAQDVNPLYAAGCGAEISTWPSAHYWRNGRPFCEPRTFS